MPDNEISRVSPTGTAINAESYQTFEMAKANDDILGGDNIEQLRSYGAWARAQSQAIYKTLAATSTLDEAKAMRSETFEIAQTFAKVDIFAAQRIGEILQELPKDTSFHGNQHHEVNSPTGEKTKTEAIKESGMSTKTAYDLQAMAANPEVVEAIIAKAEQDGRVVSRKQVLDAIKEKKDAERSLKLAEQERDAAKRDLEEAYLAGETAELEIESLREQLASKPEPQVVEREVPPADYEDMKRQVVGTKRESERLNRKYQDVLKENMELQRKLEQANDTIVERGRNSSANREVEQFINGIYALLNRHGGKAQAFGDFNLVDRETQNECRKALVALDGFAQNLLIMTEETK